MTAHRYALAAIVGAAVLWGTTGTAAAFAPSVSALAIGAGAMGIGGFLQAFVHAQALRRAKPALTANRWTVLAGSLCVVVYPLAFYSSMRVAGVALGCTVSLASAPIIAAVIERILDKRPLTKRWAAACVLGITGAVLICLPTNSYSSAGTTTSTAAGAGLGLVAGLTYAGYARALRGLQAQGISRGAATGAVFGLGGTVLVPILMMAGGTDVYTSARNLLVIGYLALVPMFLGYILFGYGLSRVDATTATTITLIEPAVATVTAVSILGESLTPLAWFGMATLSVSLIVLFAPAIGRRKPPKPMAARTDPPAAAAAARLI